MLRLIVILVIFAIFFVPARIIRVEDEKAISFQQERLPQMTREQIYHIANYFAHLLDHNGDTFCRCSKYSVWIAFQSRSRWHDSPLGLKPIRWLAEFAADFGKHRGVLWCHDVVVSIFPLTGAH